MRAATRERIAAARALAALAGVGVVVALLTSWKVGTVLKVGGLALVLAGTGRGGRGRAHSDAPPGLRRACGY
jgi:hypothetical protein